MSLIETNSACFIRLSCHHGGGVTWPVSGIECYGQVNRSYQTL